jgi:hypothetical protein
MLASRTDLRSASARLSSCTVERSCCLRVVSQDLLQEPKLSYKRKPDTCKTNSFYGYDNCLLCSPSVSVNSTRFALATFRQVLTNDFARVNCPMCGRLLCRGSLGIARRRLEQCARCRKLRMIRIPAEAIAKAEYNRACRRLAHRGGRTLEPIYRATPSGLKVE